MMLLVTCYSLARNVIAQYPVDLLYVIKPEPIYKCRVAFYMPPNLRSGIKPDPTFCTLH